ncbi:hypothetical protein NAI67_10890, partial [Francisella tularensis subsp. holarctica]|nr:hypothetical protein [Francisella tularensis subsp. holarctica]
LRIESITNSHIIKTMMYIVAIRVFILITAIFTNNIIISNIILIFATILSLVLNIFIVPLYFSLGKILASGKNEIITTTLIYL